MSRYIVRRLAFAALLVIVVSSASMILARLAPGDYVDLSLPPEASAEAKAQARARLGLDRSIGAQYLDWLGARPSGSTSGARSSTTGRCAS